MATYDGPPTWELQPGSDTPGDRIVPWQYVGETGGWPWHACLVDLAVGGDSHDAEYAWNLYAPETSWTPASFNSAPGLSGTVPAGRYLAVHSAEFAPTVMPAGWLPVEGPKFLGPGSSQYFAGKVSVDGTVALPDSTDGAWSLLAPDTAMTFDVVDMASAEYLPEALPAAGEYVALFSPAGAGGAGPQGWPEGLTPLTSVCGPVAITDENAGGVIDGIAYVVSGWVFNPADATAAILSDKEIVDLRSAEVGSNGSIPEGAYTILGNSAIYGPAESSNNYNKTAPNSWTHYGIGPDATRGFWPYLERYDLENKRWLPRIKLPAPTPWISGGGDGWYAPIPAGTVVSEIGGSLVYYAMSSADENAHMADAFYNSVSSAAVYSGIPALPLTVPDDGRTWFLQIDQSPTNPGSAAFEQITGIALAPYAAEGGFAGVIDGKLYFGGGDGQNITGEEFFVYDPATQEFEQLDDVPSPSGATIDYCAYGVAGEKVYGILSTVSEESATWAVYDPALAAWSTVVSTYTGSFNDQVQGVEIDGKLYFVYDAVYVFDPVALTVEVLSDDRNIGLAARWEQDGKIAATEWTGSAATWLYDSVTDTWANQGALATPDSFYAVAVSHEGVGYILSGVMPGPAYDNAMGVYGLTGNHVESSYDAPPAARLLTKLGFSGRQAIAVQTDPEISTYRKLRHAGFGHRQARTLLAGDRTMKALLRGGFTRHQAKALEED